VAALLALAPALAAGLTVRVNAIDVTALPEVRAFVSVLDDAGQSVKGLRRESFALADAPLGGTSREQIADFTAHSVLEGGQHLGVVLVLDRSGSMKGAPLASARAGAAEFLTRLSRGDRVAVLAFSTAVEEVSPPTTDLAAARKALDGIAAGGDTALYDAALKAVQVAAKIEGVTRRAVVLLTDGQRTAGQLTVPEPVMTAAQEGGVRLFTIGLGNEPEHELLARLAEGSGGAHARAAAPGDLLAVYETIADRLQNEYVLTFSRQRSPGFRELTVTARHGDAEASGTRKYRPAVTGEPPAGGGAPPQPAAPPPPPHDPRPMIAAVLLGLVIAMLAVLLVAAARRRRP